MSCGAGDGVYISTCAPNALKPTSAAGQASSIRPREMASPKTMLVAAAMVATVVVSALLPATASAKKFKVGDGAGWDTGVDYDAWASGKKFKVGDTLVFRYLQAEHDVVLVDAQSYADCTVPDNAQVLTSGDDHVVLGQAGQFFFICDAEGHCDSGMKLAINVQ